MTALLSTTEAAGILGIHRSTVPLWVARGWLNPAHKLPTQTGTFLFTADEVERVRAWNEARLAGPNRASA